MTIEIITYEKQYDQAFYTLNIEWLKTYFYVEPYDEEVLKHPKKFIIDNGGYIFFALLKSEVIGTVALMPFQNTGHYELTKMVVQPNYRGYRIGQQLMEYCITFAKVNGLKKLILYSNTKLENAIYIYRKYGFSEVDLEPNSPYKRSDIKMELKL
ncbi:GNAT family N-acetyltransferase [Aestuariivivens sediminis]|uniref:GNAT family N-acetyltransferase n=1 Tax=Aestuariivivens sediminis TaxID=2913557 RepID=UPI001F59890A|nr:GNAT family N-acetyltransferase [Aestuariivivens sediminis]